MREWPEIFREEWRGIEVNDYCHELYRRYMETERAVRLPKFKDGAATKEDFHKLISETMEDVTVGSWYGS